MANIYRNAVKILLYWGFFKQQVGNLEITIARPICVVCWNIELNTLIKRLAKRSSGINGFI